MKNETLSQADLWRLGQKVRIIGGPFIGCEGVIYRIDRKEQLVRVMIDIFSKQTPVEVQISALKALDIEKGV